MTFYIAADHNYQEVKHSWNLKFSSTKRCNFFNFGTLVGKLIWDPIKKRNGRKVQTWKRGERVEGIEGNGETLEIGGNGIKKG